MKGSNGERSISKELAEAKFQSQPMCTKIQLRVRQELSESERRVNEKITELAENVNKLVAHQQDRSANKWESVKAHTGIVSLVVSTVTLVVVAVSIGG